MRFNDALTRQVFDDCLLQGASLVTCVDKADMAWYGNWPPAKDWSTQLAIEVMGTSNSDPGASLFKANMQVIRSTFDFESAGLFMACGAYGTEALFWVPQQDKWVEVLAIVNAMASDPALDDMALFRQEAEDQREAFDNWLGADFERRLAAKIKNKWNIVGLSDNVDLWQVFRAAMADVNAEWVADSDGWNVYGLDKIVEAVADPAALFDKEAWLD